MKFLIVTGLLFLFVTVASASDSRFVTTQGTLPKASSFSLPYKMGGSVSKTDWNWWGSAVEVCAMIHLDVDVYTLPYLRPASCATTQFLWRGVTSDGRQYTAYQVTPAFGMTEENPVARWFFKNGFGHATTPIAMLTVCGGSLLSKKIDHRLGWAFITAMKFAEINAMHSWAKRGLGPRDEVWSIYQIPF